MPRPRFCAILTLVVLAGALLPAPSPAADLVKIRMSDNGDFLVPLLAQSLGYFRLEGLELVRLKVTDVAPEDFLMQQPLNDGRLDASYHWFQHTIYGTRHNFPVKAVMLLNDCPGAKVLVATRVRDQIRSAADFKGRHVAEGMAYATKGMLTEYLAIKAGLPKHCYTLVFPAEEGRRDAVLGGLKNGQVDIATFMEPMTSAVEATGLVTTLYDLTTREGTVRAFGAAYPGQSILLAPKFIAEHPATVQHLVNALVRAMRFINAHDADEIVRHLPPDYFTSADRQAEIQFVHKTFSTFARGDYSFSPHAVELVINTVLASDFDSSPEGVWRRTVKNPTIVPDALYTNEFVERAMAEIK
jgi:NitT/TauT family transport system substrate-binding protein